MDNPERRHLDWKEAGLIQECPGMKVAFNPFVGELVVTWLVMQLTRQQTIIVQCRKPGPKVDTAWAKATAEAAERKSAVICELMAQLTDRFPYRDWVGAIEDWGKLQQEAATDDAVKEAMNGTTPPK